MPIDAAITALQQLTLMLTAGTISLCGVSYGVGWFLKGAAFIPFRDWREAGNTMVLDSIKSLFMISLFSAISSLIAYVVSIIALAA